MCDNFGGTILMNKKLHGAIARFIIPVLILTMACSLTPAIPSSSSTEPEYRYDDIPTGANESSIIAEYQAISQWSTLDLSYYFMNDTEKLEGSTEWDMIRQAFELWASQTPLTFTEAASESNANILIGWASGDHGDGDAFDGPGDVLAHATFPNPYDDRPVFLHFYDPPAFCS